MTCHKSEKCMSKIFTEYPVISCNGTTTSFFTNWVNVRSLEAGRLSSCFSALCAIRAVRTTHRSAFFTLQPFQLRCKEGQKIGGHSLAIVRMNQSSLKQKLKAKGHKTIEVLLPLVFDVFVYQLRMRSHVFACISSVILWHLRELQNQLLPKAMKVVFKKVPQKDLKTFKTFSFLERKNPLGFLLFFGQLV